MNPSELYKAYAAVYDQDLRQELLSAPVKEDFSFIDDLSDNELVQVMEEILSEGEVTLDECFDAFDELLIEATVTSSDDRPSEGSSRVTSSSDRRSEKTAERRKKIRVGRVMQAAERAGENIRGAAKRTKDKVTGKLASAKEKITGFLGKIGRSLKAGAAAAKKEFSGEAGKEAKARVTGRQLRRAARKQAVNKRSKDTSAFDNPNRVNDRPAPKPAWDNLPKDERITTHSGGGVGRREAASSGGIRSRETYGGGEGPSSAGRALPPAGAGSRTPGGNLRKPSQITFAMSKAQSKGRKLLNQEYDLLASYILEDIINEGYANTLEEAFEVLESFSDYEIGQIAENYLVENTEDVDFYDVVLEHLLNEGYADTQESAEAIMANMSENWREQILDEINRAVPMPPPPPSLTNGRKPVPMPPPPPSMNNRKPNMPRLRPGEPMGGPYDKHPFDHK